MENKDSFQPEWIQKYRTSVKKLSDCVEQQKFAWHSEMGCLYMCRVWPGVSIWMNEVRMHRLPCEIITDYPFLKLNYCTMGRCEVQLENGKYVYLENGDLSIDRNAPKETFRYPSGKYEGLEIVFNIEILAKQPVGALSDYGIDAECKNLLKEEDQGSIFAKVSPEWDALARNAMKRLKDADGSLEDYRFLTLQLLYLLSSGYGFTRKQNVFVTKGQRRIAEEARDRLCRNLEQHYTVEELAEGFGLSPSSLKKYFRQVYGSPISEYVREMRMELACHLLRETQLSIGEIAIRTGYANQGKFGSAFKRYTGAAPLEYRRINSTGACDNTQHLPVQKKGAD